MQKEKKKEVETKIEKLSGASVSLSTAYYFEFVNYIDEAFEINDTSVEKAADFLSKHKDRVRDYLILLKNKNDKTKTEVVKITNLESLKNFSWFRFRKQEVSSNNKLASVVELYTKDEAFTLHLAVAIYILDSAASIAKSQMKKQAISSAYTKVKMMSQLLQREDGYISHSAWYRLKDLICNALDEKVFDPDKAFNCMRSFSEKYAKT